MESINRLIEDVKKVYNDIHNYSVLAYKYNKEKKRGQAQTYMIKVKYLYRKLASLKQKLIDIIKGNIYFITYEAIEKDGTIIKKEAILTNIEETDIVIAITMYCEVNMLKFNKILEINKLCTKLG